MYENFVQPLENLTTSLMDRVADALHGEPSDLFAAAKHKTVSLPQDLYAHPDMQTEWWYYTGHCETVSGKNFGFELVFFKRRTDFDRLGILPVRLLANPLYAAHFAVTDIDGKQFRYEHRKSFNRRFDLPAEASDEHYLLVLGDWRVGESEGRHILRATLGEDLSFDAALHSVKPAVLNGHEGISRKDEGEASYHFSFTRMTIAGKIQRNGITEDFSGSAWMDREFGTWYQKNWDWFSIQLDDDSELMIYQFRNEAGRPTRFSHGALISPEGRGIYLGHEDFTIEPLDFWESPTTRTVYPSGWRLKIRRFDIELQVEPTHKNQELDTRGTTMIVYWEGACDVTGKRRGKQIGGRAYAELVGYDRSHENPSLSRFLLNGTLRKDWRSFFRKRSRTQIF